MKVKLEAMQAETELANLRDETMLKMQELKNQIKESDFSCHGSTSCPSLTSVSIYESKDSNIKRWLEQNSDFVVFQKRR